ncbi:MAG: LysR family transcriptional regulator [Eubacteriales bacterium]|nr:LysR family transcriptional regulator [Eubacteriales bacterium]
MLSYEEMQYLTAFAKYGTLTEVAEKYCISQPTITRAMKKAEEVFGVSLFERTKNSIHLNDNGVQAARETAVLLKQTDEMILRVRAYDRANRTIAIGTAAAVQLPELVGRLSRTFPDKAISTELKLPKELMKGLAEHVYQMIILPFDPADPKNKSAWHIEEQMGRTACVSRRIGEEHLLFLLPESHPLADRASLTLRDLNGENLLLFSEIGFWGKIVRQKMPDSRFLVQSERYSFTELIANSVLPCFATDLTTQEYNPSDVGRVAVPIVDEEVNVTYYLVCRREEQRIYRLLFQ